MSEEPSLNQDEKELMESLAGLAPALPGVSEQSLWYEAGVRAGRRRARLWMGAAAAAVVLSSALATVRPSPKTVYVERAPTPEDRQRAGLAVAIPGPSQGEGSIDYVRLRDAVEQRGMDAMSEHSGDGSLVQPVLRALSPQDLGSAPSPWDSLNSRG